MICRTPFRLRQIDYGTAAVRPCRTPLPMGSGECGTADCGGGFRLRQKPGDRGTLPAAPKGSSGGARMATTPPEGARGRGPCAEPDPSRKIPGSFPGVPTPRVTRDVEPFLGANMHRGRSA